MCVLSFSLQRSSQKGDILFSAQNGRVTPGKDVPYEVRPNPERRPTTTPTYGIRRIDRKRRENRMMNSRMEEKKVLDRILGKGEYDPRIRPAGVYNNTGK